MKALRCYVTLHHFVKRRSPDGSDVYLECSRCGKEKDIPDASVFKWFGS